MKISEVSQLTGLSVSNIRFYERKGLLMPERQKESKYRDYSDEDIKVLKEIILYRKMNISIETIYLLQQGEVSLQTVLNRQEEELLAERQRLEGAIDLCRKIQAEQDVSRMDIDYYLNYVYEEETNGKKFAEIYELLDDVADFSHMPQFVGDLHVGKFFANSNIRRVLSILLLVACIITPVYELVSQAQKEGPMQLSSIILWGLWGVCLIAAFISFRKNK